MPRIKSLFNKELEISFPANRGASGGGLQLLLRIITNHHEERPAIILDCFKLSNLLFIGKSLQDKYTVYNNVFTPHGGHRFGGIYAVLYSY